MAKSTVDLSEFYRLSKPKKKPCAVGWVRSQLAEQEADQLAAALALDKGIITGGAIQQWAKARGHDLSIAGITSHRSGVCSCNEEAS